MKSTPKITGFVGGTTNPPAVSEEEVKRLTTQISEGTLKPKPRIQFEDGDQVRVADGPFANFHGTVEEVRYDGHGCAISQASASMMTEAALGQPVERALALGELVRKMMHGEAPGEEQEEALGDLMALEGVAKFPVRIKCALLGFDALQEALKKNTAGETH